MKIRYAIAMAVLFVTPAWAQAPNINLMPELPSRSQEQTERDRELQRAYRDTMRKIPDAKASNDPWGSVRNADAPATAPRAKAKPRGAGHQQ